MKKTQKLFEHAKTFIPGGVQLFSKRPDLHAPGLWPAYYKKAKGCEIWDLDNKHYYDMSQFGIGACLLGYSNPDITEAVIKSVKNGSMTTLNSPAEVELADILCQIHPWADQARFARTGGETAAIAVRIARAATGKSKVAVCGYHGWHDWYLAANLGEDDSLTGHLLPGLHPYGVPKELRSTAFAFKYNDKNGFMKVINKYGDELSAVVMEPCRSYNPQDGFLELIRKETKKRGIVLIFDEITIGWRFNFGGAHLKFGVNPDMAIFAKSLGNGHPIGAVIGTKEAMDAANDSFISSTSWTESVGSAAALASIRVMERENVSRYVENFGVKLIDLWRKYGEKYNLSIKTGHTFPCVSAFSFEYENTRAFQTLFIQLMLDRGFLAGNSVYPALAHNDHVLDKYEKALDEVFSELSDAASKGEVEKRLKGPVKISSFGRLI